MSHRREFADLVLAYERELAAYAWRLTRNRWEADDLVQATYERAFRRWKDLREPGHARAWLFRILRNQHVDRVRAREARPELRLVRTDDEVTAAPVVSAEVVERATADELERALAKLPEAQREVVLLCDLWGFRYAEIAEIMGVPVGTVRSRLGRAREALAAELGRPRHRHGLQDGEGEA